MSISIDGLMPATYLVDQYGQPYGVKHVDNKILIAGYNETSDEMESSVKFVDEAGVSYGVKHTSNKILIGGYNETSDELESSVKLIDESGVSYGIKHVDNKPRVSSMPYVYDIAEGNIANHAKFRVYGFNGDVDTAEETIWSVGGIYVFPTAAMGMEVVSSSVEDDPDKGGAVAGTGAHAVQVHYLDSTYAEQEETVTLNGQTAVAMQADDILRIQHIHVTIVGTGNYAAGNIDVRHLSDSPIYKRIIAGRNESSDAVWTVPKDNTGYIVSWQSGGGNSLGGRFCTHRLVATCSAESVLTAGIFNTKDTIATQDGSIVVPLPMPIKLPQYTDVMVLAKGDAGNADATCVCSFEGWYEE